MDLLLLLACGTGAMRLPPALADVQPVAIGPRAIDGSFHVGGSAVTDVRLDLEVHDETNDRSAPERDKSRFTFTSTTADGAVQRATCIQRYSVATQELRLDCAADTPWTFVMVRNLPVIEGDVVATDRTPIHVEVVDELTNGWEPAHSVGYRFGDAGALEMFNRGRLWVAPSASAPVRAAIDAAAASLLLWRDNRARQAAKG